jgi:uncharacterized protein YcfJ
MQNTIRKSALYALILGLTVVGPTAAPQVVQAGLLDGAIGGAVLGSLVGGRKGARTGAIIGGIGGAVGESSNRRRMQEQQQDHYNRQQAEFQQAQQERFQMERAAIRANEQAAAANSPQGKIVKQSQSALTLLGFDVGPADGQLNQATIDAIRSYQSSYNLLATGQPSEELLAHMRENL